MYGATNAVLVLTNTQPANSGVYRVMVHNAYGNATSDATLTVIPFQLEAKPGNVWSATNGFAVQVEGVSASNMLIIFASTDLVNWLPIFTNGSATGTVQFMDSAATNLPARFCDRVGAQPDLKIPDLLLQIRAFSRGGRTGSDILFHVVSFLTG